jgi:diguanylate cyclase (GGDEF)-like protein
MISFKKLWDSSGQKQDEGDLRVVQLLLQGIALHAVEGDPHDHEKFRTDMKHLLDELGEEPSPALLLMTTGAALQTLEDYNHHTSRYMRVQGAELHNMIAMLTKTIATLGTGSERAVTRLREIEGQIEKSVVIEDVRLLKARMETCLEGIRDEADRQRIESLQTVEGLKHEIAQARERIRTTVVAPARDSITGLLSRAAAMSAFLETTQISPPALAAFFVVDRVAVINARFGHAVGDRVLTLYLEELRKKLHPDDRIYRWSGPAFVVLMLRPDSLEKVRDQLRFLVPGKLEKTIELESRSALVPISATWTVFPVTLPVEDLGAKLDQFLAALWQQKEP